LNAAETVALRDGVAHFTIDAVAAEAGLSKGGVLYHFPSKESLIRGMVERLVASTQTSIEERVALDPVPEGRVLRAYLDIIFSEHCEAAVRCRQLSAVLLSATFTDPTLLEPLRESAQKLRDRFADDQFDGAVSLIVRLAADGLRMCEMLNMPVVDAEGRQRAIAQLYKMAGRSEG